MGEKLVILQACEPPSSITNRLFRALFSLPLVFRCCARLLTKENVVCLRGSQTHQPRGGHVARSTHGKGHTMPKPHIPLDELRVQVESCRRCPLCDGRTQTVFGVGNPHARVMFIGEAPGKNEDLQGEPFVGARRALP